MKNLINCFFQYFATNKTTRVTTSRIMISNKIFIGSLGFSKAFTPAFSTGCDMKIAVKYVMGKSVAIKTIAKISFLLILYHLSTLDIDNIDKTHIVPAVKTLLF